MNDDVYAHSHTQAPFCYVDVNLALTLRCLSLVYFRWRVRRTVFTRVFALMIVLMLNFFFVWLTLNFV